jgi:hypothetical protein
MWMNEYHADFLARDRLAEARERAARQDLVDRLRRGGLRGGRLRRAVAATMIWLGRRVAAGATPRRPARARG